MSSPRDPTAVADRGLSAFVGLLISLVSLMTTQAQTHPFIIVKSTDYTDLQALSVGAGSKAPFIRMRTDAINISNTTTYNQTGSVDSRTGSLIKIMDSTALAYIVDPANRNTYRNRFYQYLKYWDLAQTGNLTKDLNINDWTAGVKSAASFFATVVAMDIIYSDPNTTAAQITQRNSFNAMMEASGSAGPPNTMGPATFFKTQYEPYHLESLMSARAVWALWKDGIINNTALDDSVEIYKNHWKDHITEDGCYREFGGYAMARAGDPSRYNKGVFHDIIVYSGIDPDWYSDPKMSKFYEWLGGYALMPNRHTWPLGDSSYCPFSATYASPFDRAGNFSTLGLAYGEWQQNGAVPPAKLFSYLARARATGTATAVEPPSRIFNDGAAYLRQKNGGVNSLAAVLTNLKYLTVPNLGHLHRNTNSLSIAGFGEVLLRGPGYNGYAAAASNPNNFGFDFSYLNNHAISQNVALFNYSIGDYQNPSFTNDHRAKHGGYGVQGLLSDGLDYATGDSGLLTDANRAINNGRHVRHTVAIYPQDGINGYVYAVDELEGNSSATTGQLAWHPYSDSITFNSDNSSNDRYEWQIHQKVNTTDQLYFSIFMPTAPNTKQQYDGLFGDDIQGGASTSFVGKYIFNGYTLNSTTKKKNVLTMFFPRKSTQAIPTMARISPSGGSACQAAVFAFPGSISDFAMESDGASERTLVSATYDATGAAARGKAVVYRKISGNVAFYFVGKGRSFKNTPTGFTRGFVSDADVDVHMKGTAGSIVSPGTNVTFYTPGNPAVRLNGSFVSPISSGPGFARVAIPAGTHTVSLEEGAIATTTSLASNINPSSFSANVTFTATVSAASGTPTGSVTFFDGATNLGSSTLDGSGAASLTIGSLAVGARSITASYAGSASHVASTSSPLIQNIGQAGTITLVSSSANPSFFGDSINLTASVTAAAGTPGGNVTFYDGPATLGASTLNGSGIATLPISNLGIGTHSITASYAGNSSFNASTSPAFSQAVTNAPAATAITLASDINPSNPGAPVALTAIVTSGGGIPAGSVTFLDGATPLGTATLNGSGVATLSTTVLATGSHSLTASYGGSTVFGSSTSSALTQTVNANTGTPVAVSWSGGGADGLYSNTANWVGGALPATNGKALFINSANTAVSLGASHTFFSLEFGSAALGSFTFAPAVPGNQLIGFGSGANIGLLATATGSPTITFNNDLALTPSRGTGAQFVISNKSLSANLVFNGTISNNITGKDLSQILTPRGPGAGNLATAITFNGVIRDGPVNGGVTVLSLNENSGQFGMFAINGPNTYSGGTEIKASCGSLALGHKSALGLGELRPSTTDAGVFFRIDSDLTGANAINNPVRYFGGLGAAVSPAPTATSTTLGGSTFTVSSATGLALGQVVSGTGIPLNSRITGISGSTIAISRPIGATASNFTLTASAYNSPGSGLTAFTGSQPVEFSGPVSLTSANSNLAAGTQTIVAANTGGVTFSGILRQETVNFNGATISPVQVAGLVKTGDQPLTLAGANTYTGTTLVRGGALYINGNQTAATGTTTVQRTDASSAAFTTTVGSASITAGNTTGLVVGQPVSGPGVPAGSFITAITNGTSFTIPGNATTSGSVTLAFGALTGTLGGNGTIGGDVAIQPGAILSPGAAANAPGLLKIQGALNLATGSTTRLDLDGEGRGTSHDAFDVTGALTYGGDLVLDFGANIPSGNSLSLFAATSRTGSFNSVTLTGSYGAESLANNGSGLWTGTIGSTIFTFDQTTGTLGTSAVVIATTAALESSSNPSVEGGSVTFTATVSAASGTPAGSVTFFDGASSIGSSNLDGSGTAILTTISLAAGSHSLTAMYSGNTNYLTSTSSILSQVVNLTPLNAWLTANFTSIELADLAISGLAADPDGDACNNLLEYALDTNPNRGNGSVVSGSIIPVSLPEGGSENRLALSFLRARGDLTYTVEGSFELENWTDVEINPGLIGTTVTVPDTEAVVPGQRYLRLKVSQP